MAVRGTASHGPRPQILGRPQAPVSVARANRRSASGSLDDVPYRLRLPSCPADRPRDLWVNVKDHWYQPFQRAKGRIAAALMGLILSSVGWAITDVRPPPQQPVPLERGVSNGVMAA